MRLHFKPGTKAVNRGSNITNHIELREIDRINLCCMEINVDDLSPAIFHKERRLFYFIVTHIDNEVSALDSTM